MRERDLLDHPPPNYVWMGRTKLRVKFKGQTATCYICDCPEHVASECPRKQINNKKYVDSPVFIPPRYDLHFPALSTNVKNAQSGSDNNSNVSSANTDNASNTDNVSGNVDSASSSASLSVQAVSDVGKDLSNKEVFTEQSKDHTVSSSGRKVIIPVRKSSHLDGKRKSWESETVLNNTPEDIKKTKTGPSLGEKFVDTVSAISKDVGILSQEDQERMDCQILLGNFSGLTDQTEDPPPPAEPPEPALAE